MFVTGFFSDKDEATAFAALRARFDKNIVSDIEIAQEMLLAKLKAYERYGKRANPKIAYRIANNALIDLVRKELVWRKYHNRLNDEIDYEECDDARDDAVVYSYTDKHGEVSDFEAALNETHLRDVKLLCEKCYTAVRTAMVRAAFGYEKKGNPPMWSGSWRGMILRQTKELYESDPNHRMNWKHVTNALKRIMRRYR